MGIGENIKKRRKELGISAEYIAEQLGVSKTTVYRYECQDILNMGIDKLEPLAKILQTTPAELMDWDGEKDNTKEEQYYIDNEVQRIAQEIHDDQDLRILFSASRNLNKEDIKFVVDMVERLKGR